MEEFSNELILKFQNLNDSITRELQTLANSPNHPNRNVNNGDRKRRIKPTLISSFGLVTTSDMNVNINVKDSGRG